MDLHTDDQEELHTWPILSQVVEEIKAIRKISGPTAILYLRAMISLIFLGYLGKLELSGGSLAISFANITGYSVISGLAMKTEPICRQAYSANQWRLLSLTLQRTVLLLLFTSIPISLVWLNMKRILLWCGQDEAISSMAHVFIVFSLPDLFFLSLLHPLRIYLVTQSNTPPLIYCSAISLLLQVPINFILVVHFKLGIAGVAIAMVWTNLNLSFLLFLYIFFSRVYKDSWSPSMDYLQEWSYLFVFAVINILIQWIQKILQIVQS